MSSHSSESLADGGERELAVAFDRALRAFDVGADADASDSTAPSRMLARTQTHVDALFARALAEADESISSAPAHARAAQPGAERECSLSDSDDVFGPVDQQRRCSASAQSSRQIIKPTPEPRVPAAAAPSPAENMASSLRRSLESSSPIEADLAAIRARVRSQPPLGASLLQSSSCAQPVAQAQALAPADEASPRQARARAGTQQQRRRHRRRQRDPPSDSSDSLAQFPRSPAPVRRALPSSRRSSQPPQPPQARSPPPTRRSPSPALEHPPPKIGADPLRNLKRLVRELQRASPPVPAMLELPPRPVLSRATPVRGFLPPQTYDALYAIASLGGGRLTR